jgi:hypothetical protein
VFDTYLCKSEDLVFELFSLSSSFLSEFSSS